MANKVGPLIKEARTKAGLSQESLARKVDGLSAGDLGKAKHLNNIVSVCQQSYRIVPL